MKNVNEAERTPEPGGTGRTPTRREFVALGVGAFVVAALPLAGRRPLRLVRRRAPSMGTVAELGVVHRDPTYAQGALGAALDELWRVEAAMTRFRADSEVGRINGAAGRDPVVVSEDTARVVLEALRWAEASDGAFDPSIGRAVALWNVGERVAPPDGDEVGALAGRGLYRSVVVDRRRGRSVVRLEDRDAALDLGGIAKGYAVDRAAATLREWGISGGLVNAGGDLYALGRSQEGEPWRVGVRDPDDPARLIGTLEVEDGAVATSGDYEEFFEHGGRRYHHLLDPVTAAPRNTEHRSVTVVAADCMTADAAATTVFGVGRERGEALLSRMAPGARLA